MSKEVEGYKWVNEDFALQVQPVAQELWTDCTMAVIVQVKLRRGPTHLGVIGHYAPPNDRQQADTSTQMFLRHFRDRHPRMPLILAGDFNARMEDVLRMYGPELCLAQRQVMPTRARRQLDYILTNQRWSDT